MWRIKHSIKHKKKHPQQAHICYDICLTPSVFELTFYKDIKYRFFLNSTLRGLNQLQRDGIRVDVYACPKKKEEG